MTQKILVLGATGTVGGAVVQRLQNSEYDVVAAVRNLEKGDFGPGVERRWLDLSQAESYAPALEGIQAVFMIAPPFLPDLPGIFSALISTAAQAGVQHIVLSTAMGADQDPNNPLYQVEQALQSSGIAFTILRPNFYAQNYLTYDGESTRQGVIFLPAGDGKASYIDVRDIAEAVAHAFADPAHRGQAYTLTGPEGLDQNEIARIMAESSGRDFQYLNPSEDAYVQALREHQVPDSAIHELTTVYALIRQGLVGGVSPDFERLTGKTPTSFRAFAQEFIV